MMSRFLKVEIIESGIVEYGVVESGIVHSGVLGWGCNVPKSPYHRYFHENRPKTSQNARNSVNYCHENRPKVSQTAINSVKCAKTSKKSQNVQTQQKREEIISRVLGPQPESKKVQNCHSQSEYEVYGFFGASLKREGLFSVQNQWNPECGVLQYAKTKLGTRQSGTQTDTIEDNSSFKQDTSRYIKKIIHMYGRIFFNCSWSIDLAIIEVLKLIA